MASGSSFSTAQWRAVEPSASAALTSALAWRRWSKAGWSCCLTAWATWVTFSAKPAIANNMTSAVIRIGIIPPKVISAPSHAHLVLEARNVDFECRLGSVEILHIRLHQVQAVIERDESAVV